MNTPVSFELAKLLKDKRFDGNYFHYWNMVNHSGEWKIDTRIWEYTDDYIEAPTIADVVMWLYEKHEIWISVEPPFPRRIVLWEYYIQKANHRTSLGQNSGYNTPTEAYEAAIKYTLENIIK